MSQSSPRCVSNFDWQPGEEEHWSSRRSRSSKHHGSHSSSSSPRQESLRQRKVDQIIQETMYSHNDDGYNHYPFEEEELPSHFANDDSSVDLDLARRINMTDDSLMDQRSASPGVLRLTQEGLMNHDKMTVGGLYGKPIKSRTSKSHRNKSRESRSYATSSNGSSGRRLESERQEQLRIQRMRNAELERQRRLNGLIPEDEPTVPRRKTRHDEHKRHDEHRRQRVRDKDPVEEQRSASSSRRHEERLRRKKKTRQRRLVILNDSSSSSCLEKNGIEVVMDCMLSKVMRCESSSKSAPQHPSSNKCVVCVSQDRTHIAMPCGHYAFCEDCVWRMQQQQHTSACPVCSTPKVKYSPVHEV